MSIDVNVQNDLVIVTESSEDITVNVSNAQGPAGANGVGVPVGGSTNQVLKKLSGTNYDTYWAADGQGVPYSGATGDVNLGEFALSAGQLTLDTSPTGTASVGTTRWNDTTGVSETTLKGGNVILKNGVDLVARVVNKVSPNTTLTKAAYQAVRVSGAQGQRLAVAFAQANNDANSADTIGLVCETIATNQEGFIMAVGQLEGINTTGSLQGETWVDGDVLYLSPFTPGAITKVKPTGAGHIVVIGYVEYAHVNNGKIYVKVMNGWELDELHDVSIVSPANNEALIYESATSLWKNKTIASALGYTPISGTGATGQVAYWNGTNSQTGSATLTYTPTTSLLVNNSVTAASGIGRGVNFTPTINASANNNLLIGLDIQPVFTPGVFTNTSPVGLRLFNPNVTALLDYGIQIRLQNTQTGQTNLDGFLISIDNSASANAFLFNYENASLIFGTNGTANARLYPTGNLVLQNGGTFSDGGQRLQVYGDAFIKGSGATSATSSLVVQDSASTTLLNVRNDGQIFMQANKIFNSDTIKAVSSNLSFESFNSALHIRLAGGVNNTTAGVVIGNANNITLTTGFRNSLAFDDNFTPTSGTSVRNYIFMGFTINQTGGANGITRGLYVNPTLTAAADWRSIEWSNNSGWGLYGSGTAPNFLGGATTFAERINIEADSTITTQTSSAIISTTSNANLIISANGTGSLLASIPTGTAAGGNARGNYSLDLQRTRTSATQVTPTYVEYSTILNGRNNTCNALYSQVLNGVGNTINFANYSTVINGTGCTTSGDYSIASGQSTTSNSFGFTHGYQNVNSGTASVSLGWASTVSNNYGFACGFQNQATAVSSFVTGYRGIAYLRSQMANGYTPQSWGTPFYGLAQSSELVASSSVVALTTGATTDLTIDGDLIIPLGTNRFWNLDIKYIVIISAITGTATGMSVGSVKTQNIQIGLKKYLGTSTLVGTGIFSTAQEDSSMSTASLALSIGASQDLRLTFTAPTFAGGGSVTCRVVAKIELTEVAY